jgi:predicted PurR-regulated permease PerM
MSSLSDTQKLVGLLALAGGGWLLYLLTPVLTPFLAGALLAYLGDPLVDRLEEAGLSRTPAVTVVFLLLFGVLAALILLLIPLLDSQVRTLLQSLPGYIEWLQRQALPRLAAWLGVEVRQLELAGLKDSLRSHWQQAGGLAAALAASVSRSGMAVLAWLANLVLIPVVTFYLLRDWDKLVARIHELIPRAYASTVSGLARESDEVLGAFLRGQLLVMLALGVIYATGLWLVGVQFAFLIGFLAGLVNFVPYLGFIIGIGTAGAAVLLQTHDPLYLLPVAGVFLVGQLLEGSVLTPLLVGDRIGLHPVAVIFAVLAGGQLFGFVGVLLGLPVAAVLAVLLRHAHRRYLASELYEGEGLG